MPKYEYDPSKVSSTIEIFQKDDYEFIVGEPRAFIRKNRNNEDSYGIRFKITICSDGALKGKSTVYTCYLHSEGAQSMSKRFQMACYGFGKTSEDTMEQAEKKFNEAVGGLDWGFDPETGTCAEAWKKMGGVHVVGSLDVGKNPESGEPQQKFNSWRPAIAA